LFFQLSSRGSLGGNRSIISYLLFTLLFITLFFLLFFIIEDLGDTKPKEKGTGDACKDEDNCWGVNNAEGARELF
jgi:hypothetical protein